MKTSSTHPNPSRRRRYPHPTCRTFLTPTQADPVLTGETNTMFNGIHQGSLGNLQGTNGIQQGADGIHHQGALGILQGALGNHQGALGNLQGANGILQGALGNHQGAHGNLQGTVNPNNIQYAGINSFSFNDAQSNPTTPNPSYGLMPPPPLPHHIQSTTSIQSGTPTPIQSTTPTDSNTRPKSRLILPSTKMVAPTPKKGSRKQVISSEEEEEDNDFSEDDSADDYTPIKASTTRRSSRLATTETASSTASSSAGPSVEAIQAMFAMSDELVAMHPAYQKLQRTANSLADAMAKMQNQQPSNATARPVAPVSNRATFTPEQQKAMFYDLKDACDAFPTKKCVRTLQGTEIQTTACSPQDIPLAKVMFESPGVLMSPARFQSMQKDILSKVYKHVLSWPLPAGAEVNRKNIKAAHRAKYQEFLEELSNTWPVLAESECLWKADYMVGRQIKYANRQLSVKTEEDNPEQSKKNKKKEKSIIPSTETAQSTDPATTQPTATTSDPVQRPRPIQRTVTGNPLPRITILAARAADNQDDPTPSATTSKDADKTETNAATTAGLASSSSGVPRTTQTSASAHNPCSSNLRPTSPTLTLTHRQDVVTLQVRINDELHR
ncbi:hypothetical protein CF326_g8709 [Tilletia indica]|nr:hypothetical protein CF326_g8709 [Tilletia indica]